MLSGSAAVFEAQAELDKVLDEDLASEELPCAIESIPNETVYSVLSDASSSQAKAALPEITTLALPPKSHLPDTHPSETPLGSPNAGLSVLSTNLSTKYRELPADFDLEAHKLREAKQFTLQLLQGRLLE
ncbi:MAG: hypothetical protein VKJ04_10995 [Vampirovibrionales bacterium]|nr:hypothetical protein [Vampirovibrionales bacterium]